MLKTTQLECTQGLVQIKRISWALGTKERCYAPCYKPSFKVYFFSLLFMFRKRPFSFAIGWIMMSVVSGVSNEFLLFVRFPALLSSLLIFSKNVWWACRVHVVLHIWPQTLIDMGSWQRFTCCHVDTQSFVCVSKQLVTIIVKSAFKKTSALLQKRMSATLKSVAPILRLQLLNVIIYIWLFWKDSVERLQ